MPLQRSRTRRATLLAVLALAVALALGGGALFVGAQTATAEASARLDAALDSAAAAVDDARDRYDELQVEQQAAATQLGGSETTVLDQSARDTLAAALDETRLRDVAARGEIESAETLIARAERTERSLLGFGAPQRESAATLEALEFDDLDRLEEGIEALTGPRDALAAAVTAWNEHQALIASAGYANHVWASGWYPELDACRGSVDLTERYAGVPTIAEHWSCGGKDFPDDAGTIIRLTGVHEGIYRVEGIVRMLNQDTATTDDLPRGYDLLYQTCQNGQSSTMSMTALTRLD